MTNVEIQMTKEIQNPNDEGRLRAKKIVLDILYSLRHLDFGIRHFDFGIRHFIIRGLCRLPNPPSPLVLTHFGPPVIVPAA